MKTPCRHPGCGVPCRGGYCDAHKRFRGRITDDRRGTAAERGYDHAWRKVAQLRRELDAYLCQICLNVHGRLTPAKIVDHIIPIEVRPDLRLDIENTQVLCPACHSLKTVNDSAKYRHATGRNRTHSVGLSRQAYGDTHSLRLAPGGPHFSTS